jgi:prolipoprotein diacylglyceryl transferase
VLAYIPSPSINDFNVGPFEFHLYGLTYALAAIVGTYILVRRWEAVGGKRELIYEVVLWAIPAGLIGGRIYFDLTSSDEVPSEWWGPFAIWHGGLGSWGAFAAAVGVAIWRVRRAGASVSLGLDAVAPALAVAQAIGRFGNYLNQELFGKPTDLPWAVEIEPAHRPDGYEKYSTFQPTFFYEAAWDLALAAFLVWLGHHRNIRPPGLFALYVTGYSAFRIFEETLRIDASHYILGLRLNFYVATIGMIAGAVWFAWTQGWWGRNRQATRAT